MMCCTSFRMHNTGPSVGADTVRAWSKYFATRPTHGRKAVRREKSA